MFRDLVKAIKCRRQPTGRVQIIRVVGSLLIIAGLVLLLIYVYQKAEIWYYQQQLRKAFDHNFYEVPDSVESSPRVIITEWKPMRLVIPAIDMNLIVQPGDVYDMELHDHGPVFFNQDAMPEGLKGGDLPSTEGGNVAIAGHRAGRWNFFLDLDLLEKGDEIYLDVDGYRFIYHMQELAVVDKYDWSYLESTDYPALTLQTCEPKHVPNPDYRLMARAVLHKVVRMPDK